MNQSQPEKAERGIEEINEIKTALWELGHTTNDAGHIIKMIESLLLKTRTAEQERVVGIAEGLKQKALTSVVPEFKANQISINSYNQALTDIAEAIRGNEGKV